MTNTKNRNAAHDVLRMILSIMVITLHFCNKNGGKGFFYAAENPIVYNFLLMLESLCICAVNCFMMQSGYFLATSQKRAIRKPLFMLAAVSCYNVMFYFIKVFGGTPLSLGSLMRRALPINYYAWLYGTVYLISPWINLCISKLSQRSFQFMLTMMSALFVIWPTIVGMYTGIFGTTLLEISTISAVDHGAGYTLVQFVVSYLFGAYLRLHGISLTKKHCYLAYLFSCCGIFLLLHFSFAAIEYCNVFVVASAFFLTAAFTKTEVHSSPIWTHLAAQSFNVFLTHVSMYALWTHLPLSLLKTCGLLQAGLITVFAVLLMYAASFAISFVTSKTMQPVRVLISRVTSWEYQVLESEEATPMANYVDIPKQEEHHV